MPGDPLGEVLSRLAEEHDDRAVTRALASGRVVDILTGNLLDRHVYRLECGHLLDVHGRPLLDGTADAYCVRCRRRRPVVELLASL